MLYDAECALCVTMMGALLTLDRRARLQPVALQSQEGADLLWDLPPAARMASLHVVAKGGRRTSAGRALAQVLEAIPGLSLAGALLRRRPALAELAYAAVARHRGVLGRAIPMAAKRWGGRQIRARSNRPRRP
ncbi:MAG: DUF393 domain-containing protein [Actinobacteria bacterium]|nr:MAG: DUF393 domain-containing protein [Actinomycetota bacterium]